MWSIHLLFSRAFCTEIFFLCVFRNKLGAIVFAEAPQRAPLYPPSAGQDTAVVLREVLGLRDEEIASLKKTGAIRGN